LLNSAGGERGIRGFATLEFQLMLLRRMADYQPELVREATAALGVSRLALREASRRWQAMVRSATFPEGLDRLRLILGPPETLDLRRFGDAVHEHEDGYAPSRWTVTFASPGDAGRYVARFTHGLVQTVGLAED
jgi:hypothetical protein